MTDHPCAIPNSSRFFQNRDCAYFPCHSGADPATFSCLFCYCPLYALGERCGGNFRYTASGIKSCEACLVPHQPGNYARILDGSRLVCELVRRPPVSEGKN